MRLVTQGDSSGTPLSTVKFLEESPTGTFEYKILDSHINQTLSFYPEISFGSTANST